MKRMGCDKEPTDKNMWEKEEKRGREQKIERGERTIAGDWRRSK